MGGFNHLEGGRPVWPSPAPTPTPAPQQGGRHWYRYSLRNPAHRELWPHAPRQQTPAPQPIRTIPDLPTLPTQPPSLLPNGPQREIPLPPSSSGGKGGFDLDLPPPTPPTTRSLQDLMAYQIAQVPPGVDPMSYLGFQSPLTGQIAVPAGPGYMQPTPLPTPKPTPAPINMPGFTGGLKTAPANYRPPV